MLALRGHENGYAANGLSSELLVKSSQKATAEQPENACNTPTHTQSGRTVARGPTSSKFPTSSFSLSASFKQGLMEDVWR
eukprot:497214-Amphidinium_carterae.1